MVKGVFCKPKQTSFEFMYSQNRAKLTILKVMVLCLRRVDLGQGLYSVHAAKVHAIQGVCCYGVKDLSLQLYESITIRDKKDLFKCHFSYCCIFITI